MALEFECGSCGVVFERGDEPDHKADCEYRESDEGGES